MLSGEGGGTAWEGASARNEWVRKNVQGRLCGARALVATIDIITELTLYDSPLK